MLPISLGGPILSSLALFIVAEQANGADAFAAVSGAMQECISKQEVAGAVTLTSWMDICPLTTTATLRPMAACSPRRRITPDSAEWCSTRVRSTGNDI